MSLLGSEIVTVTPQTQALVDGTWVLTPGTPRDVRGTVLPIPGKVLANLPEGARTSARFVLIVEGDPSIKTTTTASPGAPADRITRKGNTYTVQSNKDYSIHSSGLPHRQYIMHEVAGDE